MTGAGLKAHHPALDKYIRDELLTREELEKVKGLLQRNKTLDIRSSKVAGSPLYASAGGGQSATGYQNVWVRDNMHLAFALQDMDPDGEGAAEAVEIVNAVAGFFLKTASRFDDIIGGRADPSDPMSRPHVRFDGTSMQEIEEYWNHKQNDALGYFMWMRCKLCAAGKMKMSGDHLRLLGLMIEYLVAIEFWKDEDNGHWQEGTKVSASSIGPVVAGAKEFIKLLDKYPGMIIPCRDGSLELIEAKGTEALEGILPSECLQEGKERAADSALLFLIYPLNIVDQTMARTIVKNVTEQLMGHIGVRRYNGDSYWCKDYEAALGAACYKSMTNEELAARDRLVNQGEEAQWTVFDPLLSVIYGLWYQESRDFDDLSGQQLHICRSLAQITGKDGPHGEWRCPESYTLCKGSWVPNGVGPLLWTQSNLKLAIWQMDKSLLISSGEILSEFNKFSEGAGAMSLEDLVTVIVSLNSDLPTEDVTALLGDFAKEGGIVRFDQLVEGLFCGSLTKPVRSSWNLEGLRLPADMSTDERVEAERVLTEVLLSLQGEASYLPLPSSMSFPARPGGMTDEEAVALDKKGFLFSSQDSCGRGVYVEDVMELAALINHESHLELIINPDLGNTPQAEDRLGDLEKVVQESVKLAGYELRQCS